MGELFWASAFFILYIYVGYPALLAVWAWAAPLAVQRKAIEPAISLIVATRNEAATLSGRIDNLLRLDYPRDRLQIVVVSDGSSDATSNILASYKGTITAIEAPASGKACALNVGVAAARHEILVFADSRQTFDRKALRALAAPFADPAVGGVSGELLLDSESNIGKSTIGDGVGLYWRYEKWLRRHESLIGSMLGATGAIYALRRSLWRPLPADTILDDVLAPMRAVLAGSRVVFEPTARAYDRTSPYGSVEFRRKTRTLAGNYQILGLEPKLLLPWANPVWIQYLSHKVGRLLVPYALALLLISSAALSITLGLYLVAFIGQLGFYGLAAYGAVLDRRERLLIPQPNSTDQTTLGNTVTKGSDACPA